MEKTPQVLEIEALIAKLATMVVFREAEQLKENHVRQEILYKMGDHDLEEMQTDFGTVNIRERKEYEYPESYNQKRTELEAIKEYLKTKGGLKIKKKTVFLTYSNKK